MKPDRGQPLFLEQRRYRLRRLTDAVHLLPILGFMLWSLPALRSSPEPDASRASGAAIYLFLVWAGLILAAFVLSRALRRERNAEAAHEESGAGESAP